MDQRYTALAIDEDGDCIRVRKLRQQLRDLEDAKRDAAQERHRSETIDALERRIKEHGAKPCA